MGILSFPISFGLGTGLHGVNKKKKEAFKRDGSVGLGWVDFWRLDFCFIFSSQSWFHFFWANIGGGQKKKVTIFWEGVLFFLKISSGGPFDLPVYTSLCTFWTMVFYFPFCMLHRPFPARVGGVSILWCIILATCTLLWVQMFKFRLSSVLGGRFTQGGNFRMFVKYLD